MKWLTVSKETERFGYGFWFWIGTLDDFYFSVPELARKHNHNRKRKLGIQVTLLKWVFLVEIPIKHLGDNRKKKSKKLFS